MKITFGSALLYTFGLVCSFGQLVSANGSLIANGSFESPVLANGQVTSYAPGATIGTGWSVVGGTNSNVFLLQTTYAEAANGYTALFNAQDGSNSIDLTGTGNAGSSTGIQQSIATIVGGAYTLSFYVGRLTPSTGPTDPYLGPAIVDVSINGGGRVSFTNADMTSGSTNWKKFTHAFTATQANTTIAFLNGTPAGTNLAGLDNVSVVPEPAAGALFGSVWLATLLFTRRTTNMC